jgi:hypothetical protein
MNRLRVDFPAAITLALKHILILATNQLDDGKFIKRDK